MAEKTGEKVRFSYGLYSAYSGSNVNDVYFATDKPWVHAQGIWRGVKSGSVVTKSSENDTLRIVTGFTDTTELTIDVDLTKIATTATQRNDWNAAATFVKSITGTDTTDVIDHWNEVVDFLAGIEGTTLQAIMETKANKSTKVFGLKGQNNKGGIVVECVDGTGNNPTSQNVTLAENFRIGINNQMNVGTYTKLTVDEFGLVTAGASLAASDIPTLAISKISGLQSALNDKVSGTNQIYIEAPLSISGEGMLKDEPTISLLYNTTTLGLSGNNLTVLSAPKLTTARTLWGNSFNGTANISGDLKFVDDGQISQMSHGMRYKSSEGFIGFSYISRMIEQGGDIKCISLGWGANPEKDASSVRINDSTFTYKGNPIYYKTSTQFTTDVNSLINTAITPIANSFTELTNRVTAVETQLKWIEVS